MIVFWTSFLFLFKRLSSLINSLQFFSGEQIKELEKNCSELIRDLNLLNKNKKEVQKTIMSFCENYEKLCQKKYPDAPLPLEILKTKN